MKSRALVLNKFNEPLDLKEISIPLLNEGEILVKMEAAGICGSDVHMWKGEDERTPLPIILGHEGVGRIVDINGQKESINGEPLHEGSLITWNRGLCCGACFYCAVLHEPSLCDNRKIYGINMGINEGSALNGCYSEYIILRNHTHIFNIDEGVDPAVLVSASCSGATIAHAFDMVKVNPGDTVVIQGPGPLGVYAVAFAKSMGASNIIVIGGSEDRLKICTKFGANKILNRHTIMEEQRRDIIFQITHGHGADLVIEAAGVLGAAEEGIKLIRKGGTYITAGYAQPAGVERIDFYRYVVKNNITVKGVWASDTRHTYQALALVKKNQKLFSEMITHRFNLEQGNEAIWVMNNKTALKAVFTF